MKSQELLSFRMLHPENWGLTPGGTFPPGPGKFPVGPDVIVTWWMWEHVLTRYEKYEITKILTTTHVWCEEERECGEVFKWDYDHVDTEETEKLVDQYEEWAHHRLYEAGTQPWPIP
jgi:hypothetical protein